MQVRLQLPAADTFRYHAGQYIEFILRDGARRAYSMANAPHPDHRRRCRIAHSAFAGGKFTDHVFGAMKGEIPARKALSAASSCAKIPTSPSCCWPRARALPHQGLAGAHAVQGHHAPPRCTGADADRVTCTCTSGWSNWLRKCRNCATCPWCLTRCLKTSGQAAPALCTRPCWTTFADPRATRSTPAAHPSWWNRHARPTRRSGVFLQKFFADSFTSEADKHGPQA